MLLVSLQKHIIPRASSLMEPCSNNVTEYNVILIGLEVAKEVGARKLEAYGDSMLIVNQVRQEYEVRHEDLIPYYEAASKWRRNSTASTSNICPSAKCIR